MISPRKGTSQDANFDREDFPGEGHILKDEALIRQTGAGKHLGRGKSLCNGSVVERETLKE